MCCIKYDSQRKGTLYKNHCILELYLLEQMENGYLSVSGGMTYALFIGASTLSAAILERMEGHFSLRVIHNFFFKYLL